MHITQTVTKACLIAVLFGCFLNSFAEVETNSSVIITDVGSAVKLPALRVERAVFLVEHVKGRGSGFLVQENGQVFFVSNIHVFSGGDNFSIKNVYGETVSVPETVQMASDRDLIRFPVDYPRGLPIAKDFGFGDELCAMGNSGGAGVITRIDGTVLALGPKLIEVSCAFIPGNSGGPILDKSNQVVCVSTFLSGYTTNMPAWLIKGSRFTETRRMASRVDNVEWITMSWSDFSRETAYVQRMEDYSDAIVRIVKALSDDSFKMIYSETPYDGIQDWVKDYNQYVRSAGSRLKRVETKTKVRYEVSSSMKRSYRERIADLTELMDDLSGEIDSDAVSTPYFKEQLRGGLGNLYHRLS